MERRELFCVAGVVVVWSCCFCIVAVGHAKCIPPSRIDSDLPTSGAVEFGLFFASFFVLLFPRKKKTEPQKTHIECEILGHDQFLCFLNFLELPSKTLQKLFGSFEILTIRVVQTPPLKCTQIERRKFSNFPTSWLFILLQ